MRVAQNVKSRFGLRGPALTLLIALLLIVAGGNAETAPSDPFSGSTPSFQPPPAEGVDYNHGDWAVGDQQGALTYSVPVVVPPGRNGMQPQLALRYSSQAPLRGGIAAGWSLDLPQIERDLSMGVGDGTRFKARLGTTSGRLVADSSGRVPQDNQWYHIEYDSSFARFQRFTTIDIIPLVSWIAYTTDGVRHYFSDATLFDQNPLFLIERQVDPFGNTIEYFWQSVQLPDGTLIQSELDRIEYTSNDGAGLGAHARIEFEYNRLKICNNAYLPIGSRARPGLMATEGARELAAIKSYVRDNQSSDWRLTREMALSYTLQNSILYEDDLVLPPPDTGNEPISFQCNQNLLRYLRQIDITGYSPFGAPTPLPPLTFYYNERRDTTPELIPPGYDPFPDESLSWDGRGQQGTAGRVLAGRLSDLIDIDGDGIADYVRAERNGDTCRLVWQRGRFGGGYEGAARQFPLPTAPWYADWKGSGDAYYDAREGCTIGGQVAYRDRPPISPGTDDWLPAKGVLSYHFIDWNGDGVVDLLTNVWATDCHWTYNPHVLTSWGDVGNCEFSAGRRSAGVRVPGEPPPGGTDYFPMTPEPWTREGDPTGPSYHDFIWRVFPGTGNPLAPFATDKPQMITVRSPSSLAPSAGDERLDQDFVASYSVPPLFDIDSDGFPDVIVTDETTLTDCVNEQPLQGCDWTIFFGDGSGLLPQESDAYVWDVPTAGLAVPRFETDQCGLQYVHKRGVALDLRDVSGDGLADLLVRSDDNVLQYYLNLGYDFGLAPLRMGSNMELERTQTDCETAGFGQLLDGARGYRWRLVDLDGDGLLDRVRYWNDSATTADDEIAVDHQIRARFNVGGRFGAQVSLPNEWQRAKHLMRVDFDNGDPSDNPHHGDWYINTGFTDISGDGLPDLVRWQLFDVHYYMRPGLPAAPDLLRRVDNGRGVQIDFGYDASTDIVPACLDSSCQAERLPQPTWLISSVEVDAGFGAPLLLTTYQYEEPHYLSHEAVSEFAERAQFAGFGRTTVTTRDSSGTPQSELVRSYDYRYRNDSGSLVDAPHGLLVAKSHYIYEGGNRRLQSHTTHSYSYHANAALPLVTLSCTAASAGMTTGQCMAQNDFVARHEQQWSAVADLFVLAEDVEGIGTTAREGDRHRQFEYELRSDGQILCGPTFSPCNTAVVPVPGDYRLRVRQSERLVRTANGSLESIGRNVSRYSFDTSLPLWSRSYQDDGTSAQTNFSYDAVTGNLLSKTRPMQRTANGGSGASISYLYDSHQIYPVEMTNELGHTTLQNHDVATGVLISAQGPNRSPVDDRWEQDRWAIDGLGRILSYAKMFDDGSGGFDLHVVNRTDYDDWAYEVGETEPTIKRRQLRDRPETPLQIWLSNRLTTNDGYDANVHLRHVGDFNGDGRDDVVGFGADTVDVGLSDGNGFSVSVWADDTMTPVDGWDAVDHPRLVGDFDGDGQSDVVGFGVSSVEVGISTGSAFTFSDWSTVEMTYNRGWRGNKHPRLVGDFDGDGRDDVVGFGNNNVWVGLSTGSGFDMSVWSNEQMAYNDGWRVESHPRLVGDFNGDGRDDVVGFGDLNVWVGLSTGSGFNMATWTSEQFTTDTGWLVERHPRLVGDFDGDGMDDVVGFGTNNVQVGLSNGGAFTIDGWLRDLTYGSGWTTDRNLRLVSDLDNDGRDDVMALGTGWVGTAYSTGHGFNLERWNWQEMIAQSGWQLPDHPRLVGDFDGDGFGDVVGFGDVNVWVGRVAQGRWSQRVQLLDGLGRVLRVEQPTAGGIAESVSTYGELGHLVAVAAPDPRDDGQMVSYQYSYDPLGRVVQFLRPDGHGAEATYSGLTQTLCEQSGDSSGGCRTIVHDALGRLVQVDEHDVARTSHATTSYQYDANDNLSQIVDGDGNATLFEHDWRDNRTQITRGSRVWRYEYDLNDNLVAEFAPVPDGGDPALHTTRFTYDDLDRLLTTTFADPQIDQLPIAVPTATSLRGAADSTVPAGRLIGLLLLLLASILWARRRSLLWAALFVSALLLQATPPAGSAPAVSVLRTIAYQYDLGDNGLGRLGRVTVPLGDAPSALVTDYGYNPRGLIANETRTVVLLGIATLDVAHTVQREYDATGRPTLSSWDDGHGQQWAIDYDERGFVDQVRWFDPLVGTWQAVADYDRALSGLPVTRSTAYDQTRSYEYDILGRPLADSVLVSGQASSLSERSYGYSDGGDLASVGGHTAGVSAAATYTYDRRHRLLTADGPNGYQGVFTYSPAGNLTAAAVDWNGSSDTRDVTYQYGLVDPQAVDRLVASDGGTYTSFGYDAAGNMIRRSRAGERLDMTWDGRGQMRMVETLAGGEVYIYDHDGMRTLSLSAADGIRFWFAEKETHYSLEGVETTSYLHLSGGGATLARIENNVDIELQYADALHNLMFALDREGAVVASFLYGAFGEVVFEQGSADHRRRFNGKEHDEVSGLRYYGYRYYDPVALRWSSADPLYLVLPDIGLDSPQRLNLYTFSLNNPLRFYDPDGRDVWEDSVARIEQLIRCGPGGLCSDTTIADDEDEEEQSTSKKEEKPKEEESPVEDVVEDIIKSKITDAVEDRADEVIEETADKIAKGAEKAGAKSAFKLVGGVLVKKTLKFLSAKSAAESYEQIGSTRDPVEQSKHATDFVASALGTIPSGVTQTFDTAHTIGRWADDATGGAIHRAIADEMEQPTTTVGVGVAVQVRVIDWLFFDD